MQRPRCTPVVEKCALPSMLIARFAFRKHRWHNICGKTMEILLFARDENKKHTHTEHIYVSSDEQLSRVMLFTILIPGKRKQATSLALTWFGKAHGVRITANYPMTLALSLSLFCIQTRFCSIGHVLWRVVLKISERRKEDTLGMNFVKSKDCYRIFRFDAFKIFFLISL